MRIRRYILLLIQLTLSVFLCGCADTEDEEIKFKVTSYNDNFNGSYSIDSGNIITFVGDSNANGVYWHEEKVDIEDQIEIEATPNKADDSSDTDVTSIEIRVYRDDALVKSVQDSDDSVTKISLTYSSGEVAESE